MLKAIRKLDRKQREGILADVILSRSAPLEHPDAAVAPEFRDVYGAIMEEVASTLHVDPNDYSPDARRKVNAFLQRELRDLTFDGAKSADSRARLGNEGILPSALYDIHFMDDFATLVEPYGISRVEVTRAIHESSVAEHYVPSKFGLVDGNAVSLFARHVPGDDPHTLIVDCQRKGARIEVHYALRIFHADVDLTRAAKAIDILEAFTKKFGSEFFVGKTIRTKFMFHERVPVEAGVTSQTLFSAEDSERPANARFTFRGPSSGFWEVSLAYAVDLLSYGDSLFRHRAVTRPITATAGARGYEVRVQAQR